MEHVDQAPPATPAVIPGNGLAVAALVLGIVGAVMGLVPLTGFVALICGVLALIFGIVGRKRSVKEGRSGKGMATAGVVTGLLALGLGIWGMTILFTAVDDFGTAVDEFSDEMGEISDDFDRDMERFESDMDALLSE